MAQADTGRNTQRPRPLSPHLQIYSPLINMTMSILHRITGGALYFGTVILAVWLFSASLGRAAFDPINTFLGSPIGLIILLGFTWALIHHALGGIRHFVWDTGHGFDLPTVNAMSWSTIVGSIIITAAIWGGVFLYKGWI